MQRQETKTQVKEKLRDRKVIKREREDDKNDICENNKRKTSEPFDDSK